MALVRDASGRVVHKASRRYSLSWPKSKAEEVRKGRILFERDAVLPRSLHGGGRRVRRAGGDRRRRPAGGRRAAFRAQRPPPQQPGRGGPRGASRHRRERAAPVPGPAALPELRRGRAVGAGKPLAFLFTARSGDQPPREATLELVRGTETVRRARVPLPPPDADGQWRVVSGLPIAGMPPGAYVLRLLLDDGQSFETRTAEVTLAP